jgi:hypothetical protein
MLAASQAQDLRSAQTADCRPAALSSLSLHPHLPLLHVTRALSLLAVLPCARLDMASRLRISWIALCLLGAGHVCLAGLLAPRALLLASIAAECGAQA